jgi:diketogulonate reductase-like aldo/keto reductase
MPSLSRRAFAASLAGLGASTLLRPAAKAAPEPAGPILTRVIPGSGEKIPAIGLGTWITFNVGRDPALREGRIEVMRAFFERGGGMIDSSPMYGSSEDVIGEGLRRVPGARGLFSATKVWIRGKARGQAQMEESRRLWGVARFDLMQIHNLLDWETHVETLLADKAAGRIRYVGITTSHGERHDEMLKAMAAKPFDFVQFSYNILDREAEKRLLPFAAERGQAAIVNRPFRTGELFERFARRPLPPWAGEIDCANWAQFLLKFAISHPAVTCAIPATSRTDHLEENMGALRGRLPDPATRQRMIRYVESL